MLWKYIGGKKSTHNNNKITIYSVIIGIDTSINAFQPKEEEAAAKTQQSINPDVTFLFSLDLAKYLLGSGSFHYYSKVTQASKYIRQCWFIS